MKKKIWKRILVMYCVGNLLMTSLCGPVLAEGMQEEMVELETEEGNHLPIQEESIEKNVEIDEESGYEPEVIYTDESEQEFSKDDSIYSDLSSEDNLDISEGSEEVNIAEDLVGDSGIVVGDNVTASFDEETGAIEFYSDGGTLWKEWLDVSGIDAQGIRSIKVGSGTVYLPKDSSEIFSVCYYDWDEDHEEMILYSNLTSLNLSGFDTTNVMDMYGMFRYCRRLTNLDLSGFNTSNVTGMSEMFEGCNSLTNLDLSGFDTSNVMGMSDMFGGCSSLTNLDLSGFDTSNVTDMSMMFSNCRSLTNMDLSSFNTTNVTDMSYMFRGCSNLTNLDLSSFDTTTVTNMSNMFNDCTNLTNLDLSRFETSNVEDMDSMFENCESITTLDLSGFDTSNVTGMSKMFSRCNRLITLDLSGFDTSNVEDMDCMFSFCSRLTNLDLSSFNTSNVTDMSLMFNDCSWLTNLDLSSFNTTNVTSMSYMFDGCHSLTDLDLSSFNTSNVGYMTYMFENCRSLTNLNLSSFDTSNVTDMSGMFYGCRILTNLDLSSFNVSNVTSMQNMFYQCYRLTNLDLSNFDTTNVTDMMHMFYDCQSLTNLDLSSFNTSNITNMDEMFYYCCNLTNLDLSSFDTSNVTSMFNMFYRCRSLTNLDLSSFDTSNVTNMGCMFYDCSSLTNPDLSSFNTSNVTSMSDMFYSCENLTNLDLSNFNTSNVKYMGSMFEFCSRLTNLDLSSFDTSNVTSMDSMFEYCSSLQVLKTPKRNAISEDLPYIMYDESGNTYEQLPVLSESIILTKEKPESKIDLSNCSIELSATNYVYDGKEKKPSVTVTDGDTTLTANTDYTVSYENNKDAGKATVKVTGTGRYKGEKSVSFTIEKAVPKLTFASESVSKTTLDEAFTNELTSKTDGAVSFASSDTKVAEVDSASGLVTIKGIGTVTITATAVEGKNYKAGSAGYTLEVIDGRTDISGCTVTVSPTSYTYNGSARKPAVTVTDGGTTLTAGTDYTVSYENNKDAGKATVKVTGTGSYKGEKSLSFTIKKAAPKLTFASESVSKTTLDEAFTNELTSKTDGAVTFASSDTKVAEVDPASGLVTIKGVGTATITATVAEGKNYKAGSASYTLEVIDGRTDISGYTVTVSPTSYTYDGSAKKPTVTVTDGDTTLTADTDYTVSYENNKDAGKGTIKVIGTGCYKGEKSMSFTIEKAAPKLTFATESISKTTLDEAFTNELTSKTDGAVTFASSNAKVAEADPSTGLVTIKGVGTATITATAAEGKNYKAGKASYKLEVTAVSIDKASVVGFSLSYGYSGKAYTPNLTVKVNGLTLKKDTDYTVKYENNVKPGTATITVTGKGNYTGTRTKTFEIVDCVSSIVSGKTYQLIPKNNSKTAVSSFGGRMVNNTKVYITDRSSSEAMKFKAIKNSDGTWKFINAKCELALAVQQNSTEVGKGLVLYDQTTKIAQNWKLSRKSDNSFAIMNAVTGYSIAMSDASAVRGTTLSMAETASSGLQRFYLAEISAVNAPFDGTKSVRAAKDKTFGLNIASASKTDGANVNLYKYSNANEKKFKIMYSGGGYYRLVNVNSGLVVSVKGNTKTSGANVIQSKWAGESGQRWKFKKNSDGSVTLTNALGTVLHLNGNKTANGTNVIAKTAAATTAQRWYLQ